MLEKRVRHTSISQPRECAFSEHDCYSTEMQIDSQMGATKGIIQMERMRVVRRIAQSLCIILLLLTARALSAQKEEQRIRNIVLVHGAWADGSGWKAVYNILLKDGYTARIVQEPGAPCT